MERSGVLALVAGRRSIGLAAVARRHYALCGTHKGHHALRRDATMARSAKPIERLDWKQCTPLPHATIPGRRGYKTTNPII
ncbi:unnamed protein product, partial [Iphiclides podalirius]